MFQDWSDGVVLFLPAAGYGLGSNVATVNSTAQIWSTSAHMYQDEYVAWLVRGTKDAFEARGGWNFNRFYNRTVRLATVVLGLARVNVPACCGVA